MSMKAWAYLRYRHLRLQARQWVSRHPLLDRLLHSTGCLSTRDGAVARGVAVGLFVALLPLFGIQTLLIILGCILVRGNFPAGFAVSWVNNPFTVAPLYIAFNELGDTLFGPLLRPVVDLAGLGGEVVLEAMFLGLGALCVAVPVAALGYLLALLGERAIERRRNRAA
jgi:uncharacterized protein